MTLRDKISISWSNLGRRKVRTALTSVGVIVGILTVVTMVSLVNGVQHQVNLQFEKIGLDRVVVTPLTEGGGGGGFGNFDPFGMSERIKVISDKDLARWKKWPEVVKVIPEINVPDSITSGLQLGDKTVPVRVANESGPRRGPFAEAGTALYGSLDLPDGRGSVVVSKGVLRNLKVSEKSFEKQLGRTVSLVLFAPRGERQTYPFKITGISSEGSRSIQISTADRLAIKGWWFNEPDQLKTQGYDSVALRATDVSQS
ncbi:hypothetical protein EON80_15005, partial [bacterium]